ncbi:MAG: DUF4118 domain-containing protein [Beijerinckiaceae bacterium]|nr:DUF4118 domain-containing protein [Beijerinckiaceae bacterium]MDO9442746.1 DUF4118 domain-containing protein [Beijerinckiaceae bacterium]
MAFMPTSKMWRGSRSVAYGAAVLSVVLATLSRQALQGALPQGFPYLTYFPVIVVVAFVFGSRPATVAAILSGLASWFFFIPPLWSFSVDLEVLVALAFFVLIVGIDILLIDALQKSARLVDIERLKTTVLLDQQTLLFQELQHRVANNMQFVASLLHMQAKTVQSEPEQAAEALKAARLRLEQLSRVHRRLYDPQALDTPVGQHLSEICAEIASAAGDAQVEISVDAPDVRLDMNQLTTLSMLVLELASNSLKHAFINTQSPRLDISITPRGDAHYELVVSDNGQGLPPDFNAATSDRLGIRIIQGFARQLEGAMTFSKGPGMRATLVFPRRQKH